MKQNHRDYIKEAGAEASSFLQDGYRLTASWSDPSADCLHFFMRHSRNGAQIHIKAMLTGYQIIRNSIIIKEVCSGI